MAFFTLKISDPKAKELVKNIKAGSQDFEIVQLNQLEDELLLGSFVFIQLGGDKVSWNKGLIGLATIIRPPYERGYDPGNRRNFKLGLKMVLVLNSVIKREAFKYYPNAYDAGGIGPNTKGEQNQAIKSLTDDQAYTIIRAMVDNQVSLGFKIRKLFNNEICNEIFGEIPYLTEVNADYKSVLEAQKCTIQKFIEASIDQRVKYYSDWLVQQPKLNNPEENYDDKTATNYSQSLKNDASKIDGLQLDEYNLFNYTEHAVFESTYEHIRNCESYNRYNADNHYTFGNALRTYLNFLESLIEDRANYNIAKDGCNMIFYGAPGCGKSRHVKDLLKERKVPDNNIFRVTFHPEYMNCDFVGQVYPSISYEIDETTGEKKDVVKYSFNPGPFTLALERAYQTPDMVYLIIEEINRGNAAAIFGDLFQLLDRIKDTEDSNYGCSEFSINNTGIQDYVFNYGDKELIIETKDTKIYIPSNLTILATMNSCDQNVFTLDTAFKRRWLFRQISNDITQDSKHPYKNWYVPGTNVTWEKFLIKINDKILDNKIHNQTNEDKRLGKYFVGTDCLTKDPNIEIAVVRETAENFAYKVFEYIWNDVCKIGREDWFDLGKYKTLEHVIDAFMNSSVADDPLRILSNIDFRN